MAPNNIHTIHSSPNPDTQARTFRDRYCPGMTRLWYLNPAKFDPRNRARDDAIRRYCMIVTFLGHTALDIIALFKLVIGFNIIGFIVSAIMSVIFFGFLCWALPTIGDAEGERVVLGKNVGRWHFDAFLMFCAVMYSLAVVGALFGMGGIAGFIVGLVVLPLWICIFLVAWVATWDSSGVSLA